MYSLDARPARIEARAERFRRLRETALARPRSGRGHAAQWGASADGRRLGGGEGARDVREGGRAHVLTFTCANPETFTAAELGPEKYDV